MKNPIGNGWGGGNSELTCCTSCIMANENGNNCTANYYVFNCGFMWKFLYLIYAKGDYAVLQNNL